MTLRRYAARRDGNESELVAAARKMGLKVFYTSELGDLIVQLGTLTRLWECKTETGNLTKAQCLRKQQGLNAYIIRTVDDVREQRRQMAAELVKLTR